MVHTELYDDSNITSFDTGRKIPTETDSGTLVPFIFVCIVISLVGFGLVTLYSASYDEALRQGLAPSYHVVRQTVFALGGFAVFALMRFIPQGWIRTLIPLFLLVSLLLMVLTLATPFGMERLGARIWLRIGPLPSFQPSEPLKVSVVLYLAHLFARDDRQ